MLVGLVWGSAPVADVTNRVPEAVIIFFGVEQPVDYSSMVAPGVSADGGSSDVIPSSSHFIISGAAEPLQSKAVSTSRVPLKFIPEESDRLKSASCQLHVLIFGYWNAAFVPEETLVRLSYGLRGSAIMPCIGIRHPC